MKNKILKAGQLILFAVILVYTLLGMYYFLGFPPKTGDEYLFLNDLELIRQSGWIVAIEKMVSIPHALLVYPFTYFLEDFVALRFVNILLLLGLYLYFYLRNKPSFLFYCSLTFFVGTSKVFFIGTNDALFVFGLVVFFNEIFKLSINKPWKPALALVAMIISFFTRAMFVVYLPVILLGIYVILKNTSLNKKQLVAPVLVLVFFLLCNMPSLIKNRKLSYDLKSPPSHLTVGWTERQYLAQILVNDGKLANNQHPSFQETQDYINLYGSDALPHSLLESLLFNPKLTIIEFFKDFYNICFYGFRQMGLLLFIPIWYLIVSLRRKPYVWSECYIPITLIIMMCIFAFIIITYVELRWLMSVFIMVIVFSHYLDESKQMNRVVLNINSFIIFGLSIYGLFRLFPKLIT